VAPVERDLSRSEDRVGYHVVEKGQNLYLIASWYDLDHRELARWNRISPPSFQIRVGQKLWLSDPAASNARNNTQWKPGQLQVQMMPGRAGEARAPSKAAPWKKPLPPPKASGSRQPSSSPPAKRSSPPVSSGSPKPSHASKPTSAPEKKDAARKKNTAAPTASSSKKKDKRDATWRWPSRGKLIYNFAKSGNRGLDISDKFRARVSAAAAGRVVYTGSGLRGYGKLIIIKHNARYLSAYGNNDRMLVKEGDKVKGGQKIAEMGKDSANRPMLHFEIRKDGKPVDPLRYLPSLK